MSLYTRTNWQDHNAQYARRYTVADNGDGTVTLTPVQGEIYQQGTPITAGRMNNIENRIDELLNVGFEVLWTNANPSARFAAQTVDLSRTVEEGEICLIAYGLWAASNPDADTQIALCLGERGTIMDNRGNKNNGSRNVTISGSTCTFAACTYAGTTGGASNDYIRPFYIAAINPHWLTAAVSPA